MSIETSRDPIAEHEAAARLFARVVIGVDGSPEGFEAARQAALLTAPGGTLTLLSAWELPPPLVGFFGPNGLSELEAREARTAAEAAVTAARAALAPLFAPAERVVRGLAHHALLAEVERAHATLVAVGSHGVGRLWGILIGSTATEVVHLAPCSVLVTRTAEERFPRRVAVGVDGSPESAAAYAAARSLAARCGAQLWPVVAHGGKGVDLARVDAIVGHRREDLPDDPVDALVAASADADLVVVGSRGLHGRKALGSVSERVAHEAHASTLVVRLPVR